MAHWHTGLTVRQWPERLRFNLRSSHSKDSKIVLDASLLNTQYFKVQVKGKWSNLGKGVVPFHAPRCSRY